MLGNKSREECVPPVTPRAFKLEPTRRLFVSGKKTAPLISEVQVIKSITVK